MNQRALKGTQILKTLLGQFDSKDGDIYMCVCVQPRDRHKAVFS